MLHQTSTKHRKRRGSNGKCNECFTRPIQPAQARSIASHPLRHRTIPCPQGIADGDDGFVRQRRVEFWVWGRLTVEPCFSRPANSRAEPSRPSVFISLVTFFYLSALFLGLSLSLSSALRTSGYSWCKRFRLSTIHRYRYTGPFRDHIWRTLTIMR